MNWNFGTLRSIRLWLSILAIAPLLAFAKGKPLPNEFYQCFHRILSDQMTQGELVVPSFGSNVLIQGAFEKEGMDFSNIAQWFDHIDEDGKKALRARLRSEQAGVWIRTSHSGLTDILGSTQSPK